MESYIKHSKCLKNYYIKKTNFKNVYVLVIFAVLREKIYNVKRFWRNVQKYMKEINQDKRLFQGIDI